MYYLVKRVSIDGNGGTYKFIRSAFDISDIIEELKQQIKNGSPVNIFKIVKNVDFEFKCAVQIKEEKEE